MWFEKNDLPVEFAYFEERDLKGIVCFLTWGHIKYISIVDLFSTVISDQHSLSLEK